jgi:hypothetical protein
VISALGLMNCVYRWWRQALQVSVVLSGREQAKGWPAKWFEPRETQDLRACAETMRGRGWPFVSDCMGLYVVVSTGLFLRGIQERTSHSKQPLIRFPLQFNRLGKVHPLTIERSRGSVARWLALLRSEAAASPVCALAVG